MPLSQHVCWNNDRVFCEWPHGRISNTFIFHLEWRIARVILAFARRFYAYISREHFSFPSRCRDSMRYTKWQSRQQINCHSSAYMRARLTLRLVYCFPRSAFCCVHTVEHFYTYQIFCVARALRESQSRDTNAFDIVRRIFPSVMWKRKRCFGWEGGCERHAGLLFGPIRACSL